MTIIQLTDISACTQVHQLTTTVLGVIELLMRDVRTFVCQCAMI